MTADKRLEELLDLVVAQGGSDLHIFTGGSPMLRVSGALIPVAKYPALAAEGRRIRVFAAKSAN